MTAIVDRGAPLFDGGGRDYNHATDSDYKRLRDQANSLYDKRNQLSLQSQQAYKRGDKEQAHQLSEQAKQAVAQAEEYSKQAAQYVFQENNADSAADEIDLHGLYVKEAKWILQQRIAECMRTNQQHLKVIVGKGLHLKNGVAKLKPAVDEMCQESGLTHYIDKHNTGVLVIDFTGTSGQVPSHWNNTPIGTQPGYHQQPAYSSNPAANIKTGNSLVDALLRAFCGYCFSLQK